MTKLHSAEIELESTTYPAEEWVQCPYPLFAAIRSQQPVYRVPGRDEYVISRYEDALSVLRSPELFTSRVAAMLKAMGSAPLGGFPAVRSDDPEHKMKRRFSSHAFTAAKVQSYRPMIQRHLDELIDGFIGRGSIEFVSEFAMALPIHVIAEIMGLPLDKYEQFARWGRLEGTATIYQTPERRAEQDERSAEMAAWVKRAVIDRHEHPGEDLISQVIANQVAAEGEFDLPLCVAESMVLISAGLFTTTHMLTSAMQLLVSHPEQMRSVRADAALVAPMVEEALRLESPAQWVPRIATRDAEIGGVTIPEGATVLVVLGSANRDEERFRCPEAFDIQRPKAKQHIAFGSGVHTCLGAPLARLEGQMSFATLLARLGEIRFAESQSEFRAYDSMLFRALDALHLEFTETDGVHGQPVGLDLPEGSRA